VSSGESTLNGSKFNAGTETDLKRVDVGTSLEKIEMIGVSNFAKRRHPEREPFERFDESS